MEGGIFGKKSAFPGRRSNCLTQRGLPSILTLPNPAEPELNRFEAWINPKSEYRNPKQIRNSNDQKQQIKGRHLNLDFLDLFRISDFVLRIWNGPFPLEVSRPSGAQLDSYETKMRIPRIGSFAGFGMYLRTGVPTRR